MMLTFPLSFIFGALQARVKQLPTPSDRQSILNIVGDEHIYHKWNSTKGPHQRGNPPLRLHLRSHALSNPSPPPPCPPVSPSALSIPMHRILTLAHCFALSVALAASCLCPPSARRPSLAERLFWRGCSP